MISKSIPGQLGYQSMILMQIISAVGKNEIRIDISFDFLKIVFNFAADEWEKSISIVFDDDILVTGIRQKEIGANASLIRPLRVWRKYNPMDFCVGIFFQQS